MRACHGRAAGQAAQPDASAEPRVVGLRPFSRSVRRIAALSWLGPSERSFLDAIESELMTRYQHLDFELPAGIIHGDASVGNVIRDYASGPVLIDLDGFCVGPREWDLVQTAPGWCRSRGGSGSVPE